MTTSSSPFPTEPLTADQWDALEPIEQARAVLMGVLAYGDQHHWAMHSDLRGWLHGHAEAALHALGPPPGGWERYNGTHQEQPGGERDV